MFSVLFINFEILGHFCYSKIFSQKIIILFEDSELILIMGYAIYLEKK